MDDALRLSGCREPLGLCIREGAPIVERSDLRTREIEFSSRGDRVPGRVVLPADGAGPLPLVLLQDEGRLDALGLGLGDAAVATIDLPLRGARADRKLLALALGAGAAAPAWQRALAYEFTRQAVIDLERTLDALSTLAWIDADRIAFVGLGSGARLGAPFCALDARIRAAAFAPETGATDALGDDADAWIARIAPRPVLRLDGSEGGTSDRIRAFLADVLRAG